MASSSQAKNVSYWYVVEGFERRESTNTTGGKYDFIRLAVFGEGGQNVVEMTCPCRLVKQCTTLQSLPSKRFFAVTGPGGGGNAGSDFHLSERCKVYAVGRKFHVDGDVIGQYEHPPVVDLDAVQHSPVKTRVSIKGLVRNVAELRGADRKRVREVEVGNERAMVTVCLWGDQAETSVCSGEELVIGPLVVGVDKRSKMRRLNSVKTTCLERERFWTCVVEATSEDGVYPMDLLLQGGACVVLDKDFGVSFGELPKAIILERSGDRSSPLK